VADIYQTPEGPFAALKFQPVAMHCPNCGWCEVGTATMYIPPEPGLVPYCPKCLSHQRWTRLVRREVVPGSDLIQRD